MNNCFQKKALFLKALFVFLIMVSIPVNLFSFSDPEKSSIVQSEYVKQLTEPIEGIGVYEEKIDYPKLAIQAGLNGNVIARIFINTSGDVDVVTIDKSAGGVFDEKVEEALKEIKFKPVVQNGDTVKAQFAVAFQFRIK